jgi:aspartyl-tRNA(Asn)/glutamyl-tRNA(Gln) amidotransferase subunit A
VRTLIIREFKDAFKKYDALVTPTSPTVPFKLGEKVDDPIQMYLSDVCTLPINIAGLPAISIPAGFADGLPIGMQVIGKPFDEETILRIAFAYEQATEWHKRKPPI